MSQTQGERVRIIRKTLGLTLEKFGERIGMRKNSVSQIESGTNALTEKNAKIICKEFDISEEWLMNGSGPMYQEKGSFNLEEYVKSRNVMDIELDILRAYFDLDPEIRSAVINSFKKIAIGNNFTQSNVPQDILDAVPDTPEEFEKLYPVTSTEDNHDVG